MAMLYRTTIICIVAALIGQGVSVSTTKKGSTTSKKASTTMKASTTRKATTSTTTVMPMTSSTTMMPMTSSTTMMPTPSSTTGMTTVSTTTRKRTTTTLKRTTTSTVTAAISSTTVSSPTADASTTSVSGGGSGVSSTTTTAAAQGATTTTTVAQGGATTTTTTQGAAQSSSTTTTTTLAHVTTFKGSIVFSATGLDQATVKTAATAAVAAHFGVAENQVSVVATKSSRRLAEATLRRLADTWNIEYTLVLAAHQEASVQSIATAADTTAFTATLSTHLVAAGAPQSAVDTIVTQSLTGSKVTTTTTTTTTTTVTAGPTTSTMGASTSTTKFVLFESFQTSGSCLPQTHFLLSMLISCISVTLMK